MLYTINNIRSNFNNFFNTKKELLNKNNQFAVKLDDTGINFQTFIQNVLGLNVTVAGDGSNAARTLASTLQYGVNDGKYMLFGGSTRFDAELYTERQIKRLITNDVNVYRLSNYNELYEAMEALYEFKGKKEELMAKYPRNKVSSTMKELSVLEEDVERVAETKKKKTRNIEIFSNFIIDENGDIIERDLDEDVIYVSKSGNVQARFDGFHHSRSNDTYRKAIIFN